MKDIELPPPPYLGSQWTPYWTKVVHEKMQAYARAAVEADRAQRVPDGWVLIATDAYEAGFGKGEQAHKNGKDVENPWGDEPGREAWAMGYALGKERAASTPAPAQQETSEAEMVCAEAYQVVGCLLSDLGLFETEAARKILDNLSEARRVHQDVLPWESAAQHQDPPQQERKPMTQDQIDAAYFSQDINGTPFQNGIKAAERHHGIFAEPAQGIKE